MSKTYYTGKALPGSETRADELADSGLAHVLQTDLAPGTFNVMLTEAPPLGEPDAEHGPYRLWACQVSTAGMIERDEPPYPGWILRVVDEYLPSEFVEIISPVHLRTAMNCQHWPAFPVEVALNSGKAA